MKLELFEKYEHYQSNDKALCSVTAPTYQKGIDALRKKYGKSMKMYFVNLTKDD